MNNVNYRFLKDKNFLLEIDKEHIRTNLLKITILNKEEESIGTIEGNVTSGNISINGSSSVRRTCNLSLEVDINTSGINDMLQLLSIEKRIRIEKGLYNTLFYKDEYKDYGEDNGKGKVLWFPQGIFLINQLSFSHNLTNITISISGQDKMCLLNGTMGGSFPTSITFGTYQQLIEVYPINNGIVNSLSEILSPNQYYRYGVENNGSINWYSWNGKKFEFVGKDLDKEDLEYSVDVDQRIYDIILTCVNNYGGIPLSKIIINDVPLQIKQIARYIGTETLWFKEDKGDFRYQLNAPADSTGWVQFGYNDEVGYVYTDFIYPSGQDFVTNIGDNVCTVLDKIIQLLGNYEYYFDADGNFIFQEKRNYLNNSYNPVQEYSETTNPYLNTRDYAHNFGNDDKLPMYGLCVINEKNYKLNLANTGKSVYNFSKDNELIISYVNAPNYPNIKNDYHIWGKFDNAAVIHYHVAIKKKPTEFGSYKVRFKQTDGLYNGKLELIEQIPTSAQKTKIEGKTIEISHSSIDSNNSSVLVVQGAHNIINPSVLSINDDNEYEDEYVPNDWRAELYLRGLSKKQNQQRPDIFEQELLDLFDEVYDFKRKQFKNEGELKPNNLRYFLDFIEPVDTLHDVSIDEIGEKLHSFQEEKIVKIYNTDIPNCIMIDKDENSVIKEDIQKRVKYEGEYGVNVDSDIMKNIVDTSAGYTAQEVMRNLLYQYTSYAEAINLNVIPILYLEPNTRITVADNYSNIAGDYIINSISVPLDNGTMTISASRALERN